MALKYTKEEKELMKKAYDNALDYLDELWKTSEYKQISVEAEMKGIKSVDRSYPTWEWRLVLNDKEIFLKSEFIRDYTKIELEQKSRFSKKRRYDYSVMEIFLKEFESLRQKVETRIIQGKKEKAKSLKDYELILERYSKESHVEIELPNTLNQHHLEITRENGQTIGKLNFGSAVVKIITRGNISVEKDNETPHVKRK